MPTTITSRREWIDRMNAAGKDQACWKGFYDSTQELAAVALDSCEFSQREIKAAVALELVAQLEGARTDIMCREFAMKYKILGAPGDFGYDTREGRAMQAVYEWWNRLSSCSRG